MTSPAQWDLITHLAVWPLAVLVLGIIVAFVFTRSGSGGDHE